MIELKTVSSNVVKYPQAIEEAVEGLTASQANLMAVAVRRAADDTGAAMAHQLSEPLTALLLYLHDLRRRCQSAGTDPDEVRHAVEAALRAAERTCELLEVVGHSIAPPIDTGAAVARGATAIDLWKCHRPAASVPALLIGKHPLTAREVEVLTLVIEGASNKKGGLRLGISSRTFETHRAHIMRKVGAKNTADLIRIALNGTNRSQ